MTRKPIVPDADLWDAVRNAITPLKKRPRTVPQLAATEAVVKMAAPPVIPSNAILPSKLANKTKPPPPLTGLDRRLTQKLTRGKIEIDARLDLHGLSVELARVELRSFLNSACLQGLRTVLVITGKGDNPYARHTLHGKDAWHAPERQGRIRRAVTSWFEEAEFRSLMTGFQPAHPRHGGGGAYYIRLRKREKGNQ